ncbi:hypothetical protein ACGFZG_02860 [Streptomyces antibioticus]|uniref:hypothetical protein n=1 Tax=Streptomyces antibioticus TaxID=1890 RepID=UPI0037246F44
MVVSLAVLSACSGSEDEDGKDRSGAPIGWSTCDALFGAARIDALQDEMGQGTLAVLNQTFPVGELTSGWVSDVKSWEPGQIGHVAYSRSTPCDLGIDGTGKRFQAHVSWSRYSFEDIKSQQGWKPEGSALYVLREDAGLHLTAVVRCKIEGSRQEQEPGLPLKVETRVSGIPDFDTELLGELTAGLARNLAKRLPCTNGPEIPSAL